MLLSRRASRKNKLHTGKPVPSGSDPYTYEPLATDKHIRLLCLYPGDGVEPLYCEIKQFSLFECPKYEALSYVWGDPSPSTWIYMGTGTGQHIGITTSLEAALRDLRWADVNTGVRVLWVDGVCINQKDIQERNQQVQIMGDIYRTAGTVVVYIGQEAEGSGEALNLAALLIEYVRRHHREPQHIRLYNWADASSEMGIPAPEHPVWKALRSLLRRPWSSRSWILQEFILNQNTILVCGNLSASWDLLYCVIFNMTTGFLPQSTVIDIDDLNGVDSHLTFYSSMHTLEIMGDLRLERWKSPVQDRTLLQLLQSCRGLECADPHDRIYSLLGIASDSDGIIADYAQPVEDLYFDFAVRVLQFNESLELLSNISARRTLNLPSWVPDWSTLPEQVTARLYANHIYMACGDTAARTTIDTKQRTLNLDGALVDRIIDVTETIGSTMILHRKEGKINISESYHWLLEQLARIRSMGPYPDGSDSLSAFWRTLIGDWWSEDYSVEDMETGFIAILALIAELHADSEGLPSDLETLMLDPLLAHFPSKLALDIYDNPGGWHYNQCFSGLSFARVLCRTQKGYLGLAPMHTCINDHVAVFNGGRVPFIIRDLGENFKLVGESYIHGIMKGEALEMADYRVRTITLV